MKFFIVGKQASGKLDVLNQLERSGYNVGREFSNIVDLNPHLYIDPDYVKYSYDDINKIFETNAYLCIDGIAEKGILDAYMFYRGVSMYTYDRADALILSPNQVVNLNKNIIREPVCFVWMDNTVEKRRNKFLQEHRTYSFEEIESIEKIAESDFVKTIYNFPNAYVMYFMNELPERVATIVGACIKHPDLSESFIKNFN